MTLSEWRRGKLRDFGVSHLYYLSKLENLESILDRGILSQNVVRRNRLPSQSFAEETVQQKRHQKAIELTDRSKVPLHDLVPLYLITRTPTLSARRDIQDDLVFLEVSSEVICDGRKQIAFTDGNAASADTKFFRSLYKLSAIPWDVLKATYWTEFADGKRRRCVEFLIYPYVDRSYFTRLLVVGKRPRAECLEIVAKSGLRIPVEIERSAFFV